MASLTLRVDDAEALRALVDSDMSKRRAFGPGASGVEARTACVLVIAHGERTHTLAGEVVYVRVEDPGRGVGLALAPLDAEGLAALRAFAAGPGEMAEPAEREEADVELDDSEAPSGGHRDAPARLHDRLLALSGVEQQRMAAAGSLAERVALERMYGPNVWPTLLENGRVTIPAAARIARKGTLPR